MLFNFEIGRWKTINHSKIEGEDDFHTPGGVKDQILKRIDKKKYAHRVGDNPDIRIDKKGMILLAGSRNGPFKNAKQIITNIQADDYFILRFIPSVTIDCIEILLYYQEEQVEKEDYLYEFFLNDETNKVYMIPNESHLIAIILESIYESVRKKMETQSFLLILG